MKKIITLWMVLLIQVYAFGIKDNIATGSKEKILSHGIEWKQNYDKYVPDNSSGYFNPNNHTKYTYNAVSFCLYTSPVH